MQLLRLLGVLEVNTFVMHAQPMKPSINVLYLSNLTCFTLLYFTL